MLDTILGYVVVAGAALFCVMAIVANWRRED